MVVGDDIAVRGHDNARSGGGGRAAGGGDGYHAGNDLLIDIRQRHFFSGALGNGQHRARTDDGAGILGRRGRNTDLGLLLSAARGDFRGGGGGLGRIALRLGSTGFPGQRCPCGDAQQQNAQGCGDPTVVSGLARGTVLSAGAVVVLIWRGVIQKIGIVLKRIHKTSSVKDSKPEV